MPTVDALLAQALVDWPAGESAPPRREVRLLLSRAVGLSEGELLARGDRAVTPGEAERFLAWIARRREGEPIAYLLGEREFFGLPFRVDRRVLIPRPETETLVEAALELPLAGNATIVDVGTGSGAIAVALATRRPSWQLIALDLSLSALAVARGNAARNLPASRVAFLAADGVAAIDLGRFDLLISNPPYVATADRARLPFDVVGYEPAGALFSGDDGLTMARDLVRAARALPLGGWAALEIGDRQAADLIAEIALDGAFSRVELRLDLAGVARVVIFQRGGSISHRRT